MKKALFTLAVFAMAFGNVGLAQNKASLRVLEKKTVMNHYGLRAEGDLPETAIWKNTNGYEQKRIYSYDESDFYLTEVLEQAMVGGNWVNNELVTYDYGFDGEVLEAYDYAWYDDDWYAIGWATYTYRQDEMEIVYQFRDLGEDWQNYYKEVYNYNGDVTTILIWEWNGSTWSSSELYTYTFSDTSIEVLMQYMQGGAWQNEEKDTYMLDFDGHVKEVLVQGWVGTSWVNDQKTTYNLVNKVFPTKIVEDWTGTAWEETYQFSYIYECGNATHGECKMKSGGEWYPSDGEIEMAYGYGTESEYYCGVEVDVVYVDVNAVDDNVSKTGIVVYPVPADNEIFIQAEDFQKAEIYSLTGQKMIESLQDRVDVGELSSGLYIIKVYDLEGNCATQRFMVK